MQVSQHRARQGRGCRGPARSSLQGRAAAMALLLWRLGKGWSAPSCCFVAPAHCIVPCPRIALTMRTANPTFRSAPYSMPLSARVAAGAAVPHVVLPVLGSWAAGASHAKSRAASRCGGTRAAWPAWYCAAGARAQISHTRVCRCSRQHRRAPTATQSLTAVQWRFAFLQ